MIDIFMPEKVNEIYEDIRYDDWSSHSAEIIAKGVEEQKKESDANALYEAKERAREELISLYLFILGLLVISITCFVLTFEPVELDENDRVRLMIIQYQLTGVVVILFFFGVYDKGSNSVEYGYIEHIRASCLQQVGMIVALAAAITACVLKRKWSGKIPVFGLLMTNFVGETMWGTLLLTISLTNNFGVHYGCPNSRRINKLNLKRRKEILKGERKS